MVPNARGGEPIRNWASVPATVIVPMHLGGGPIEHVMAMHGDAYPVSEMSTGDVHLLNPCRNQATRPLCSEGWGAGVGAMAEKGRRETSKRRDHRAGAAFGSRESRCGGHWARVVALAFAADHPELLRPSGL
jgi:hypothetical protein